MPATSSGGSTIYPIGQVVPNSGQTVAYASWNNEDAGAAVYTVPVGKTFYLLGFILSGAVGRIGLQSAGAFNFQWNAPANTPFGVVASVPIGVIAAGGTAVLANAVNGNTGCLWGFVQ